MIGGAGTGDATPVPPKIENLGEPIHPDRAQLSEETPESNAPPAGPGKVPAEPAFDYSRYPKVSPRTYLMLQQLAEGNRYVERVLANPLLQPKVEVQAGAKRFFFSDVVKVEIESGEDRYFSIGLVPDQVKGKSVLKKRLYYKSDSGGNWRYTPYLVGMHFNKGLGRHYTAETQPAQKISDYLDGRSLEKAALVDKQDIWSLFNVRQMGPDTAGGALRTFGIDFPEVEALRRVQRYQPGRVFSWDNRHAPPTVQELEAIEYPQGFLPDFTKKPVETYSFDHSLLGIVRVRVYGGSRLVVAEKGNRRERPVLWGMAEDASGRTWIQFIRFVDAEVNSHGTYDAVIDSGILTSKPLEYRHQTDRLDPIYRRYYDQRYDDITPLLAHLTPIRLYLAARGASLRAGLVVTRNTARRIWVLSEPGLPSS